MHRFHGEAIQWKARLSTMDSLVDGCVRLEYDSRFHFEDGRLRKEVGRDTRRESRPARSAICTVMIDRAFDGGIGVHEEVFLQAARKTELHPGCVQVLEKCAKQGIPIEVLSINWSAEWIRRSLTDQSNNLKLAHLTPPVLLTTEHHCCAE